MGFFLDKKCQDLYEIKYGKIFVFHQSCSIAILIILNFFSYKEHSIFQDFFLILF